MACSELAALRVGLMNVIGIDDPAEKKHELDEIGDELKINPSLGAMVESFSLNDLKRYFSSSLAQLDEKIQKFADDDKQLAYYKTLLVMTKKAELDLENHVRGLQKFYEDLEDVHDFIHEVYPVES